MPQNGDDLPVSVFTGYEDGTMPAGTAAYEKRGIGHIHTGVECRALYPV